MIIAGAASALPTFRGEHLAGVFAQCVWRFRHTENDGTLKRAR